MPSLADTLKQIKQIMSDLIKCSLIVDQNFPSSRKESGNLECIDFGKHDISIALDNQKTYKEIYDILHTSKVFTCKLIDGALIQLMYEFKRNDIYRHRLAFFSSPYLEKFQNEPEYYDEKEIYSDILSKNIVAFPIRFDYDSNTECSTDVPHPASHFTLGQYKNCRIPVSSPVTPSQFFDFILRNFYNTAFNKYSSQIHFSAMSFSDTITTNEQQITHIRVSSGRDS